MSWDGHTGSVVLPFGLAVLLVSAGIAGSYLQPARKRQVEAFFLLPSFILLAVFMMAYAAVWEHHWMHFVLYAAVAVIAVWRLLEHRRASRR